MKEGGLVLKHKHQMPSYYGKNIVQHAQKKFLKRKTMEANEKRSRDCLADTANSGKKE